jgi:diacylglycerol kinase family enzyme
MRGEGRDRRRANAHQPGLGSMKASVVLNTGAGAPGGGEGHDEARRVAEAFGGTDVEAELESVDAGRLSAAVRAAAASNVDIVIVGGGDGSLSAAAAVLAGGKKPLGVLPLGTLNHFAQDLGIPLELAEAVRIIATGRVREVDVGEVNGHIFINNSSIGLYPWMVEEREARQEHGGWSKWPAMLLAVLKVVGRFRLLRVRIRTGDRSRLLTTPFVFVGNNQYKMRLFSIGARSCLDRGELSLYVAKISGRAGLVRLVLHALTGRLEQTEDFEALCLSEMEIDSSRPALRVARDGEVTQMRPPLRYRVRPRALRVLAPPDGDASTAKRD